MEILTLEGENIFCFGKFKVDFGVFGQLTRIEGDNQDSSISRSNGAGKTSLYETLFWTYFGQTKKGLAGNDVINEHAPKGACCYALSTFNQGGRHFRITRKRNSPPNLKLEVRGATPSGWGDMTKGTDKETQALLESIIKMSSLTFSKMTYFGQEDVKSFADMGDKDLKAVFEQALGIEFIRADHEKVCKYGRQVASEVETIEGDKKAAWAEIERLEEKVRYLTDADIELKRQHDAQVTAMEAEIASLMKDIADTEEAIKTAAKGAEAPNVAPLTDELERLKKLLSDLRAKLRSVNTDRANAAAEARTFAGEITACKNKLRDIAALVGQPCEECGKKYEEADLLTVKSGLSAKFSDAKAAGLARSATIKGLETTYEKLEALESKMVKKIDDLKAKILTASAEYEREIEKVNTLQGQVKRLRESAATKNKVLDGIKANTVGYEAEIKTTEAEAEAWRVKVADLKVLLGEAEEEKQVATLLKEILGDAGLKNYVFSAVTPELNRYANEYLQSLDSINVEISTVKQLKSGEFRDKFEIKVDNQSGSSKYKGNSGGERRKIDMAISMAFNAVIRAMAEESVNLLFLDEPFESLDEDSSEAAVELTNKIAGGSKTFLVAHSHYLKGLVYESVTVQKKGGFSTIKGAK